MYSLIIKSIPPLISVQVKLHGSLSRQIYHESREEDKDKKAKNVSYLLKKSHGEEVPHGLNSLKKRSQGLSASMPFESLNILIFYS